jgi:hypothetical protein
VARILRGLPFFEEGTRVSVAGQWVPILHHQIIVWVSVARAEVDPLPPSSPRFPAVLDTGFTDNFLISEAQLLSWGGVDAAGLPPTAHLTVGKEKIPVREANVWIHPNRPGFRDEFAPGRPFCLELDTGVAVWPATVPGARRLPLLGLRGLRQGELSLHVDCRRCRVSLSTASSWMRRLPWRGWRADLRPQG